MAKKQLGADSFAFINSAGELQLRKDDKLDIPDSTIHLKKTIESRMELVRIEKMLADIDTMYNFSQFFTSPEGFEQKISFDLQTLYAAIVALGTNLGFIDMSNSTTDISLEKLKHVSQWCISPEVITATNNFLVKKHSEHPLSQLYGDFSWSGSDGERFCIRVPGRFVRKRNTSSYFLMSPLSSAGEMWTCTTRGIVTVAAAKVDFELCSYKVINTGTSELISVISRWREIKISL